MWFILSSLLLGFVAGLIARAFVRGAGPRGCLATTAVGMVGSLLGGLLGYLIFGKDPTEGALQWSGLFGSVFGASMILLLVRQRHQI